MPPARGPPRRGAQAARPGAAAARAGWPSPSQKRQTCMRARRVRGRGAGDGVARKACPDTLWQRPGAQPTIRRARGRPICSPAVSISCQCAPAVLSHDGAVDGAPEEVLRPARQALLHSGPSEQRRHVTRTRQQPNRACTTQPPTHLQMLLSYASTRQQSTLACPTTNCPTDQPHHPTPAPAAARTARP